MQKSQNQHFFGQFNFEFGKGEHKNIGKPLHISICYLFWSLSLSPLALKKESVLKIEDKILRVSFEIRH